MPYIGNTATDRFVASKAASVYSGNGSTTAFTLEHSVGSDEDILVSVDGVIQEPSVAYAVSSGTTLTFTAAPSSNSGNNIFVYYLFRTVGTVSHPSNQALTATTGTFSGAITGGGVLTTGGNVVIPNAGNIGSASDTDAIAISSGGVVTLSQSSQRAQTFVLQADQAGGNAEETLTNWGESSSDYTRVGAANFTQSSGIFSSATTGTFLCMYNISVNTGDAQDAFDFRVEISTNSGSSFTGRGVGYTEGGTGSGPYIHGSNQFIFTVSNTTTFRLRYRLGAVNSVGSQNEVLGDSDQAETSITFIKLGVI